MAYFSFTQSVGAGATYNPLTPWQYQQVPAGGKITVLINAAAIGVVMTLVAGSDQLVQRCPVTAGGTSGVMPTVFSCPVVEDLVAAQDPILLDITNTTGGAIIVQGYITYEPA